MNSYQNIQNLLQKIEANLNVLKNTDHLYKDTLNNLKSFTKQNDFNNQQLITEIFADCYHTLLGLEKNNNLSVKQTALLNNLDELEDFIIREK